SAAQLYTVNLATAALTPVGSGLTLGASATTRLSMDFNPVVDRIRVVTVNGASGGNGANFRVNPNDGMLTSTDTALSWTAGDPQATWMGYTVVGLGYTNSFAGASTTTLYAWDY